MLVGAPRGCWEMKFRMCEGDGGEVQVRGTWHWTGKLWEPGYFRDQGRACSELAQHKGEGLEGPEGEERGDESMLGKLVSRGRWLEDEHAQRSP